MTELILNDCEKKALMQILNQVKQTGIVKSIMCKLQRVDSSWFCIAKEEIKGYDT